MLMDAVIWHWVMIFMGEEAGSDGFVWDVQWPAAFLYADNRLLVSPRPDRLQMALGVLTGFFDNVLFCTNINKTVNMVIHTC